MAGGRRPSELLDRWLGEVFPLPLIAMDGIEVGARQCCGVSPGVLGPRIPERRRVLPPARRTASKSMVAFGAAKTTGSSSSVTECSTRGSSRHSGFGQPALRRWLPPIPARGPVGWLATIIVSVKRRKRGGDRREDEFGADRREEDRGEETSRRVIIRTVAQWLRRSVSKSEKCCCAHESARANGSSLSPSSSPGRVWKSDGMGEDMRAEVASRRRAAPRQRGERVQARGDVPAGGRRGPVTARGNDFVVNCAAGNLSASPATQAVTLGPHSHRQPGPGQALCPAATWSSSATATGPVRSAQ